MYMEGVYFKQLMPWLTMSFCMGLSTRKVPDIRPKEVILMFSTYVRECSSHQLLQLFQLLLPFGPFPTNPFHAVVKSWQPQIV